MQLPSCRHGLQASSLVPWMPPLLAHFNSVIQASPPWAYQDDGEGDAAARANRMEDNTKGD